MRYNISAKIRVDGCMRYSGDANLLFSLVFFENQYLSYLPVAIWRFIVEMLGLPPIELFLGG
jgi:hypothetical protein